MFPAVFATLAISISSVAASRASRLLDTTAINLGRICVGVVFLGLWAEIFGQGLHGSALPMFFLSGCIGFGIGDMAVYPALRILGARSAVLIVHSGAAFSAAVVEWMWLGTRLTPSQIAASALILVGVIVALAPRTHLQIDARQRMIGVVCAIIAGLGQGMGAVISRKAFAIAAAAGDSIDGGTAAFQRVFAGLFVAIVGFVGVRVWARSRPQKPVTDEDRKKRITGWWWVLFHGLAGPTIGIGCYQWALKTTPTGIVLPIVATAPLLVIPISWVIERDRPTAKAIVGCVIAVTGVVLIKLAL